MVTPIHEEIVTTKASTFGSVVGLLKDKTIFLLFLGIVFVVGTDVGMNTAAPKILMERCGLSSIVAGYGPSVYFAFRTLGAFLGAVLLAKYASDKFFKINIVVAALALVTLFFVTNQWVIFAMYGVVGFTVANIFPIIYSNAIQRRPDKANEISGLMITGVFGGAVIPFFMGVVSDKIGSQNGSLIVILLSVMYLIYCSLSVVKKDKKQFV